MLPVLACFVLFLQRLWFKTNLKLGKLYNEIGEYAKLSKVQGSSFIIFVLKDPLFNQP